MGGCDFENKTMIVGVGSDLYREGHERIFGKKGQREREWVELPGGKLEASAGPDDAVDLRDAKSHEYRGALGRADLRRLLQMLG